MFFAFSILYLTTLKSPLRVEIFFAPKFVAQTSSKISPQTKNPGYVPARDRRYLKLVLRWSVR